uniref:Uncharacterized protein n=1 Tax=Tanacetum cinerariifolium TaxID=118510 RepID=A0A699GQT9_TANCI|nr:hypothetical protein [Tanacetum cinerariifolium]
MIQVKEMMQDKDLKNSKSKDKDSRSRSQSMNEQSHYKQEKTKTRPKKAKLKSYSLLVLLIVVKWVKFWGNITALEKEVAELKKDPLHTQVTALVDDHLDARLGATRDEFMNFLSASLTARITEQMVKESLKDAILAKESSQPQSSYDATATLTEFELKKILIDKMDKSESYLAAPKHKECYEGLKKSYDLDKIIFSIYGEVYLLKRCQKDKDEDPFVGSDRGLKIYKMTLHGTSLRISIWSTCQRKDGVHWKINELTSRSREQMVTLLAEMWNQNQRDLPRDIPLDNVEFLGYEIRIKARLREKYRQRWS